VYDKVGGSYHQLSQYLKAKRATASGRRGSAAVSAETVLAAMAEQVPSTLEEELQALTDAEQAAESRLSVLEEKSQHEMLSESEEIEMVRLERRLGTLAVNIERAQAAVAAQQEQMDIDGFVAQWAPLADEKRRFYEAFQTKTIELWQALLAILQQHEAQILLIQTLPDGIQRYMLDSFLPDGATMRSRLAANMVNPQGWTSVLCQPGPPRVASAEELMQNDPGCQLLPPRLLQNALEQRKGVTLERSA
jgi:hypothetical protein